MSGIIADNAGRSSGLVKASVSGILWQSVTTGTTLTAVAGRGYPINTTSNACTITLPASASVGDTIKFVDYARNWGTNALTLNQNSLNFQGNSSPNPIYDTNGQAVTITYVDATKGWLPTVDDDATFETPQSTNILFKMWGAGGGGADGPDGAAGSPGGYVAATVPVIVSTTVYVVVGSGGGMGSSSYGSGGGGYSGIFKTSGTPDIANVMLMVGGGGGSARGASANGGGGGGTTGVAGWDNTGSQGTVKAGQGGTQSAGGAAGTGTGNQTAGAALTGGFGRSSPGGFSNSGQVVYGGGADGGGDNSSYTSGGGGGGYYGGGGGGDGGGGGGGGSSFVAYAGTSSVTNTQGTRVSGSSATVAPNNSDDEYDAGVGVGGAGITQTVGGNGLVAYSINSGTDWTTLTYTGSIQTFTAPSS